MLSSANNRPQMYRHVINKYTIIAFIRGEHEKWVLKMFKNTRGIRQSYPLAAVLFVLSVEIMASRLRTNKDIKGFQIKIDAKNHSIKISQLYFVHLKKTFL